LSQIGSDEEAKEASACLRALLPRRQYSLSQGRIHVDDVDGDGTSELLRIGEDGLLSLYSVTASGLEEKGRVMLPYAAALWNLRMFDLDRDGRREIVVGTGDPGNKRGRLYVVEWTDQGPLLAAADETLQSFCGDFALDDREDDRHPELFVATGYFERSIRMYQYANRKLVLKKVWAMGTDPDFLHMGDGGLTVLFGPWNPEIGFRSALLLQNPDDTWRLGARGPDRFHASAWSWLSADEVAVATFREPKELGVCPELAAPGLYRFRTERGTISGLELLHGPWPESARSLSLAPLDIEGERFLVSGVQSIIHVVSIRNRRARSFDVGGDVGHLATGDFDGDGDSELVFQRGDVLEVWGMGRTEIPVASKIEATSVLGIGRRSVGEELLEAKLYAEAEYLFRKSLEEARSHYGLGMALAGQSRFVEAAVAFAEASRDPTLGVDASLRRAHALQNAREWKRLAQAVSTLEGMRGLDPFADEAVRNWKRWVARAAALSPQVCVAEWKPGIPLLCENPFESRVVDGRLEVWDNALRPGSTGLAIHYDGGPLRIRFRMEVEEPSWESAARLGLHGAASLGLPQREGPFQLPSFCLSYGGEGATDRPVRVLQWQLIDPQGRISRRILGSGQELLRPSREYTYEIEYIPVLDRLFVSLTDGEGRAAFDSLALNLPFRFEGGLYQVGGIRQTLKTVGSVEAHARMRIRSIEVEASTPATRLWRSPSASARELLLLANGDLVLGAVTEAAAGFEAALQRAEDAYTRWRAHLFRALLHLRVGRKAEAALDVQAALAIDGQEPIRLLAGSSPALSSEEKQALLGFAGD